MDLPLKPFLTSWHESWTLWALVPTSDIKTGVTVAGPLELLSAYNMLGTAPAT